MNQFELPGKEKLNLIHTKQKGNSTIKFRIQKYQVIKHHTVVSGTKV